MYTEHEHSGGGGGDQPEHMSVGLGFAVIPMLTFKGGCETCQTSTRKAFNELTTMAMSDTAKAFVALMEKGRGNCEVKLLSPEKVKELMTEMVGPEFVEKLLKGVSRG